VVWDQVMRDSEHGDDVARDRDGGERGSGRSVHRCAAGLVRGTSGCGVVWVCHVVVGVGLSRGCLGRVGFMGGSDCSLQWGVW